MIKAAEKNCITRNDHSLSKKQLYRIIESQKQELADINSKFAVLTAENEKLRCIFDTALEQFAKQEIRLKKLGNELEQEKQKNKKLEKEVKKLSSTLCKAEAKAKKYAQMLFGTKRREDETIRYRYHCR